MRYAPGARLSATIHACYASKSSPANLPRRSRPSARDDAEAKKVLSRYAEIRSDVGAAPYRLSQHAWGVPGVSLTRFSRRRARTASSRCGSGDTQGARLQDAANLGRKLAALLPDRIDSALLDTYETERRLAAERGNEAQPYAVRAHAPGPRNHSSKTTFRRNRRRAHSGETSGRHHVGRHSSLPNLAPWATACGEGSCRHRAACSCRWSYGMVQRKPNTVAEMSSGTTPVTGIVLTRLLPAVCTLCP